MAFRKRTLLPLDDCLYALQASIAHLTGSSLHRLYQRHGISRLPDIKDGAEPKQTFKSYPIGDFHIDIAEVSIPAQKGSVSRCKIGQFDWELAAPWRVCLSYS